MKSKFVYTSLVLSFIAAINSCTKENITPKRVVLDLSDDPGSSDKFKLGRVLFYDQHLSQNNSLACASCHKQELAFSDNVAFSKGFENELTLRNAPPIQNLSGSALKLFWDGRESSLGNMVLKPIENHVEMGMSNHSALVNRVKNQGYYPALFKNAFGSDEITVSKISEALAEFVRSIQSNQTRLDKFNRGEATLGSLELTGRQLFISKYKCNSCHPTNFFYYGGGETFVNIGLDLAYADNGRGGFTQNASDNGKFKIPNMRNITLTAPYMHDGRFATLDQVLEHYSHGIKDHPNLDADLKDTEGHAKQFNISPSEKDAIIAYLSSHTDYEMITAKKFSNPFKIQ